MTNNDLYMLLGYLFSGATGALAVHLYHMQEKRRIERKAWNMARLFYTRKGRHHDDT